MDIETAASESRTDTKARQVRRTLKDEVRKLRQQQILRSATELFFKNGFQGTSLEAIAKNLGATKPFIYYYYKDKSEILSAVAEEAIQKPLALLGAAEKEEGPATAVLRRFISNFTRVQIENQAAVSVFFREEANLPPATQAKVNMLQGEFDHRFALLIKRAAKESGIKVADVPLASLALGGMICWVFTWYKPGGRLTPDQLCEAMADFALSFLNGRQAKPARRRTRDG